MTLNILFVQGFDTVGYNTYKNLEYLSKYNTDYFYYEINEPIHSIQKRLNDTFNTGNYDIIIGHSMGCFFVSELLKTIDSNKKLNIILLMPYIVNDSYSQKFVYYLPNFFAQFIYGPRFLFIPSQYLTYKSLSFFYNFLPSNLIPINPILASTVAKKINFNDYLNTYKNHNVTIVYGTDDQMTPISEQNRQQLKKVTNFIEFESKHEPFNDDYTIQNNFKELLLQLIHDNKQ